PFIGLRLSHARHADHPAPLPFPTRRSSDLTFRVSAWRRSSDIARAQAQGLQAGGDRHLHRWAGSAAACVDPIASQFSGTSGADRSEEHTSELQSRENLVCRLLLEKKKKKSR